MENFPENLHRIQPCDTPKTIQILAPFPSPSPDEEALIDATEMAGDGTAVDASEDVGDGQPGVKVVQMTSFAQGFFVSPRFFPWKSTLNNHKSEKIIQIMF